MRVFEQAQPEPSVSPAVVGSPVALVAALSVQVMTAVIGCFCQYSYWSGERVTPFE